MSERLTVWLVIAAVVTIFVVWRLAARAAEQARCRHFARLAGDFGAEVATSGEANLSFVAEVGGRTFEIRDGYQGGGAGSETTATRYLTFSTALRGRSWDLHDVKITSRRGRASAFDERFRVEEFGMRLPDQWLNGEVRAAITSLSQDLKPEILIERGNLVYRSMAPASSVSPAQLLDHLRREAALAEALERSRGR